MYIQNNIKKKKKLNFILMEIYGINKIQANYIMNNYGLNLNILITDVTINMINELNEFISINYLLNKDLKQRILNNKKKKILLYTYKGYRLKNNLPCNGQNTHSNAKTNKY